MRKTDSLALHQAGSAGHLLDDLERRQDDVIAQLDDLDSKLEEVLKGLEPERTSDVAEKADAEMTSGEYFA